MHNYGQEPFNWWFVFGPIILVILGGWLATCIVITRQQTVKMIEELGKYTGYRQAGLSFKKPFPFAATPHVADLRIGELSMQIGVKTKDNAFLILPIKAQVRIMLEKVYEAVYSLQDAEKQIVSYIENIARAHANTMTMEEVFSSREEFQTAIVHELRERFLEYGREVVNILIDEPQPGDKVRASFDRVISSQRELEAARNEAEARKTLIVGEASAHAESLEIRAKSYVEQRKTIVNGMDNVLTDIGHERVLQYLEGIDMRDTVRDAANGHGNVVVVPIDMSSGFDYGKVAAMHHALGGKHESAGDPSHTNGAAHA